MNGALGEDCALELAQGGILLDGEGVFENQTGLNV